MDSSTFSAAGVERIHATGAAVIDLSAQWPTTEMLLGGDPAPIWDVDAPLDRPIEARIIGPDGEIRVLATTLRVLMGADGVASVIGLTRPFDATESAAAEVQRTADIVGLAPGPTQALIGRLSGDDTRRRRRHSLLGGESLGVRVGLTVHCLPARDDVPSIEVLEWSVTPIGDGRLSPDDHGVVHEDPSNEEGEWLRL